MSINKVVITGYTCRDAELRQTQSGCAILNFCVAVNDRVKNASTGEWDDYPNFVNCTLFGKRAESLAQYMPKGTRVAVDGKLHYSSWQGDDGKKKSKLEVTVSDIELLSKKDNQEQSPAPIPVQAELLDNDVPF